MQLHTTPKLRKGNQNNPELQYSHQQHHLATETLKVQTQQDSQWSSKPDGVR